MNNVIIKAKLRKTVGLLFFDQYPVDVQNFSQVRPDKNSLLAQIGTPFLVNIWSLQ